MSGGKFDYKQYEFGYIADEIESIIEKMGREKTREEINEEGWNDPNRYEKYPEDKFHYKYPDKVTEKFKKCIELLKETQIYVHRIDWLLSGDDSEDGFLRRLNNDLKSLK